MKRLLYAILIMVLAACTDVRNDQYSASGNQEEAGLSDGAPNVLIIVPDQLRRYSAGYWSQPAYRDHVIGAPDPVVTPNIDELANNGVVFTNAISNFPLCSPYRGMLLTGTWPARNGLNTNARSDRTTTLNLDVPTITGVFRSAGYNIAYFGKAHWLAPRPVFDSEGNYVGSESPPGGHFINHYDTYVPPGPARLDIEYYFHTVIDAHFDYVAYSNDPHTVGGLPDGSPYQSGIYSTKAEATHLIDYLENTRTQRDSSKPFLAIWMPNPPHLPWDDENVEPEVLDEYYAERVKPNVLKLLVRGNVDSAQAPYVRHYFANVTSVDKYIGQVLDALEKSGLAENTIVVFSSDHGEMLGSHGRQGKNVFLTEALAIPLIIHWPKALSPAISDVLVSVPDVMPTILGLAGQQSIIPTGVQGRDLSQSIVDPDAAGPGPADALLMLTGSRGILSGHHMLYVRLREGLGSEIVRSEIVLFDNEADPYQLAPLRSIDSPRLAQSLLARLGQLLKEADDDWYHQRHAADVIPYP